ncbi:MAG: DUF3846 domain-containing protein [Ruminococcaceae bacterium]|nr:DUF3846 domain-containing protein [Oscillospiraceae bacterium]
MSEYIIKIEPNHRPRLVECGELTLEYMQTMVEGPIEVTSLCRDLSCKYPELRMIVNEEGKLFDLHGNLIASIFHFVLRDAILGTALMVIADGEELRPMTEAEATDIRETIENCFNIEFEEGEEE